MKNKETLTKGELIMQSVVIGFATSVIVLVSSSAVAMVWSIGKAFWKTLIK